MKDKPLLLFLASILLLTTVQCRKSNQPAATPKSPRGIDRNINIPPGQLGVEIENPDHTLVLNIYPKPDQDPPEIRADLGDFKQVTLPYTAMQDGHKTTPLRTKLVDLKKEFHDDFQVFINAPADMKYAQLQAILQETVAAGITRINFITNGQTRLHFLPCDFPIRHTGPNGEEDPTLANQFKITVISNSPSECIIKLPDGTEFKNGVDPAGNPIEKVLDEKRQSLEKTKPNNQHLLIAPKLSTRYNHVIAAYEIALLAKWPKVGFMSTTE